MANPPVIWYTVPMATRKQGISAYQAAMKPASREGESSGKGPAGKGKSAKKAPAQKPAGGERPEALIKATVPEKPAVPANPQGPAEAASDKTSGYRKAAGLLLLVGKEKAAEILRHFSPEEIEKIVHEIALIRELEPEEASVILTEFHEIRQKGSPGRGGVETARQMLLEAFGPEKGEALYRKVLPFDGGRPFTFLNELEHNQIALLLRKESPRVLALVLGYVDPKKASLVLEGLESSLRLEVVQRMARKSEVHPEVIQIMEQQFRERIREQGRVVTQELDGSSALAGILRYMDPEKESRILEGLSREVDPDLSESIRERIFTVQDILRIPDPDFQTALRDYGDEELAVIIKGKQPMVREKFLSNVSERRREMIREESDYRGAMLKKDVEEATRDFLQYLRTLEEDGKIRIPRGREEYI